MLFQKSLQAFIQKTQFELKGYGDILEALTVCLFKDAICENTNNMHSLEKK